MNLRQESVGNVLVLTVEGRLDASSSDQFQNGVLARMGNEGGAVVIDLAPMTYVSSAGIRSILIVGRTLQDQKRGFALCCPQPGVAEVLTVSGVDAIVQMHASRDEALKAL